MALSNTMMNVTLGVGVAAGIAALALESHALIRASHTPDDGQPLYKPVLGYLGGAAAALGAAALTLPKGRFPNTTAVAGAAAIGLAIGAFAPPLFLSAGPRPS